MYNLFLIASEAILSKQLPAQTQKSMRTLPITSLSLTLKINALQF